jgi:hypothetical protein
MKGKKKKRRRNRIFLSILLLDTTSRCRVYMKHLLTLYTHYVCVECTWSFVMTLYTFSFRCNLSLIT